ncbi:TetR/AcrR family transcriptional regulator [Caulobacter sp. NIBR2454]|uniref:TetR/AcrR family transcriptional regulator n=1 Tax=Caulobacter sp. NIBR2454 TaxID=3015996 RepID=UPI0022B6FC58|nr:TetR/AcrR family transcriptional regulator [Caulobacter sp. NIBR2454]
MTVTLKKPQKSARKAKGDGHMRRGEILHAAERIFVAEGYHGATIRKIADEVGVSSTALYMHFRDKDQILLEISDCAISRLLEINSQISAEPIDAVARVRRMLEAYMTFAFDNPNAYELVFCSSSRGVRNEKQEAVLELGDRCFEKYLGVIKEVAAQGRLRTGTAETAAETLWAACHGLVSLMITKPDRNWSNAEDLKKVMLDGLLYGLVID